MTNNDIDRIVNNSLFNAKPIITDSIKSGVSEVMKSNVSEEEKLTQCCLVAVQAASEVLRTTLRRLYQEADRNGQS